MGNLKAITDTSEFDVVSNVTWENGRIYFIKSDEDEGETLSVTVTFNDKEKYSSTNGVVDLLLPKVNNLNGNHYYSFPSDIIELFGGEFTARTPTPTPEQETPTPFLLSCISKDTTVEIVNDGGKKYAFGPNGYQTPFKLNVGIYKLSVHPDHPLYLHGNDESQIKISGSTKVGIGYINDVEITVYSDFGTISYGCTAHGWMGGENNLVFDANCGLGYLLPTPTPTPEEETPTPLGQPQSGQQTYDDIPWLTTTAKFVVATDSENDYSKLILENTSFDFDEYPFKDNIPSKNSYPSFYVYILKDSYDGNLMDIYTQGIGVEYPGNNSLGYFYNYVNGEKQSSSAFSSNSGPGLAYVVEELVAGRTASYPTNADIISDDTYGYSNFEDWLGTDTQIKVGILGFDYDPSAGVDIMLAEYFIPCTIEYEPTPTPIPPLPDLNTWLSFDSQKFYTDANVSGQPPYRLVLENVTITESAIPNKIKTAISQGKLRLVSYPIRSTYTGSPFTPIGSDSAGNIYQPNIFFSYNGQSNQVGEGGVITNRSYSDTIRLSDFWNFYSDFAGGLTVGSALYSESGDDLDTWKGSDDVKLGFGIAIAHSDYDYEVLYNERFDLQILQFLDETPTPIPAPTPTPEQPTPTPIPVKDLSHQTNTPNVLLLDNDQDINLNGYKLKENQKLGYNIGGYGFISGFSEFIKFTDENKNEIPNIKITEYQGFGPLEYHNGGYSSAFIIHFKENVGNVSIVNAINNEFIAKDLLEFSTSTPQGQWTYNWDPTPTPTPTQTPESLSKWFEFDEIKINFTDSTEKNLHLEFTNLKISHADVPDHILQAIADSDLLVSYKIVKESDLSNAFGSTSILGKYANEEVDSSNTLNFYQGISSFENGNYAGTISNNDQTYGDWLGSDNVKIQILMVNFSTSVSYEYNEIHDVDLVTQDFISRIGPSTIFKNFIYKYELVSGVTLNENLENGDFILAKNNTKLKVNLTNKVIGQLLSNDDPKNDPRAKIKSLEIGGEFNYTSGVQTKGELGTDFISELNLTRLSNIENLTIINQTNLFKIENLSEITSLNNLFISNSTPNEAHIEIMNSTGFTVDFSNFSLPTNLKYLGIFSTNTLNPINNLPDSLITLRTDMVEDLRLVSSTNSANSFISESCEANDQTTGISVNSFSNLSDLHLYSCEIFTDLKCKFPSLTNLKIVSTQTKILPELPQTLSELDISSTSISEITNGFPNNLDTLNARGSGLSEFKNIPDTLEVIDISNTPIATDASSFSISVNRGNVKTISLGGFNYIPDLSNLTGLQSLVMRDLSNSDSQLPSLPSSLKTLIIENANLQDISSLSSCNNLERVEMAGNEITDVSALNTSASTLSYLSLDNNNITSGNFSAFANLSHLGVEGNSLESLSIPQNLDSASIDNNPYSTSLPNFSNLVSSSFSLTMKSDTISSNQKINIIKSVPSDVSLTIDVKNATFPNESWWVDSNVTKLTLRGNVSNVIPTNCSNLTFNSTELSSINLSGQSFEYLSITNNTSLVNLNVGDNVNSFYFNNNPNVETFEGNPSIDNLMLSGSKIKTIEIPNSCKNVTLSNCKQLGSGIPDTESPIKLNSSYEYLNLKKIQIDESECKSEHIEAIFKEFSIFYDTLNAGTNETRKLQNVMFSYIGNSKRPTTADDFYLNLKTNAEWQFEPFDPELAQYVVLPDNELIDIDNLSANEKEPTFVTTEATSADLIVKNSQVGMLGVFPYPFFFGDQRWDFFEAGVTKLVSVGNLQQVNITWLGYGSTYLSMYDSTDSLNVSDLECVPKEIKLSAANVSSILREGDSDLLSLITNQTYIKIESNEIELFASQYQPMIFGGEAPIIFNVDAIESSDAMKIRLWRGEQLDTATEITNQVPWANMSYTNVNGSPYSTFYGNPNAYSPNGTSQIYINPLASLNVDFMSIEFADQRKLPQGYNDGIQFKFSSECNVDPTPSPTPFGSDILDTWFSSDQTKFQIYGEDDVNSQDKAAFVKFDNLSINRQSLHDDLNSSIIQITLYVIDKNSHTDTDYGDINTQVVSDDVLCSSMILNSTLDEQSNSFFLYNTFDSQNEYGSSVNGLGWNKSHLSINEETAYFRFAPSTFLKNIEDYDNVALVFQVATYSYNIFGAPSYYYHKFENTLIKEEWGVQTPTPLPQPTPTPTPESVYEANATDWSVYTNDPSLETLLSQFNSNDLDNVTTSDPGSSFTGIHDSRDNNGTGWVTTYLNGALHGYSRQYQNNVLTWELHYNNNNIVGISLKWWPSTGHLRQVEVRSGGQYIGRILWNEYETEPYIDELRKPKVSMNSIIYQQESFRDILFDFTIENPDLYPVNSFELSYKKGGSPFDNFQFDNYGHTITFNLSDVTLNDINSSSDKTFEYSLLNVDSDIVEGDLLHYRIRGIGLVEGTYEYFSGYYISEPTPTPTPTQTPTPKETPTPIPQDQPTPTPVESRIVVRFNAQQASNISNFSIIIRSLDGGTSTVKVYNSVYTYNADDALETVVYDDTHAGGWQPFTSALVYEKYGYHDNKIRGWILEVTGDIKSLKIHNSLHGNSYHDGVSSIELYGCDGIQEIPDLDSEHYKNLNYVHFKNFDAGSLIKTNPFQGMFKYQTNLYTVYGLDTIRNLENIISTAEMFNGCTSLNVDQYANSQSGASMKFGSNWSSAPITNVNHMFSNCTSLNYNNGPDFSEWCVSEIQTEPPSFASGSTFTNRPRFGNECGNVNLGGSVIDGYVKNAPGQLIDLSNGNIIKEFTSDDYGRWSIDIEQSELPDLYKVKFLPGGIDILTNKQVNTTFSNIAKKEDALTSSSTLNITPVTTLKSAIVETKIQQKKGSGESYDVDSIITTTKQFVASKFDISENDLESDYIKEQKTDVLKANTKLSVITETLKSTVSQVDDSVTEDIIFASIATQFESTMETEETSNEDISVTDLLNNNIETIVKNSVDDSFQTQITSDSSIVQNIEFLSEVVLEVIDTPSDTENSDTFEDSLQNVRKEILTTIEFVEDVVSTSDIGNEEVVINKESALESIDNSIDLVEDIVIDDMIQPELGVEEQTPTPTFASYYFAEENQSNSHTFQKYHEDESMLAYDTTINGKLFDVLVMKNEGFVEVYIGGGGAITVRLGTLPSEYKSNHSSGLNWVNYFESTYEGLSISSSSIQSQINIVIPDSLLEMADSA